MYLQQKNLTKTSFFVNWSLCSVLPRLSQLVPWGRSGFDRKVTVTIWSLLLGWHPLSGEEPFNDMLEKDLEV